MRSITKESLYEFVQEFWDTIIPETPIWNWHIKYLCDELQYIAERVFLGLPKEYDLIVNVSPGSTKSTICSVMFPAWVWTRMPSAGFIGGSYTHNLAMDLALRNRDIVLSDKYRAVFPEIELRADQSAKSQFMNTKRGCRIAVGVGGSIIGRHGHFLVIDDPLDPRGAVSEAELKTANKWMSDTLSTRKKDKAITPTILIMQRLHQDDCTANMVERARETQKMEVMAGNKNAPLRLKHICLPAELTDKVNPPELKKFYQNGLIDPIRFSREVLHENRATLLEYGYAGQFLQWPVPAGGGMFKPDRIVIDAPPIKWKMRVRYWDKAGTAGAGAFTVGALLGKDVESRFWILDIVRGQWDSYTRNVIIKQVAQLDGQDVIIGVEQEPGSGGKESAESTVKQLAGWIVRIDKPSGSDSSKELRAEPFAAQINGRNVFMSKGEWNRVYLNEMEFFPKSTYKDQVDASSGAFNMLTKRKRLVGGLG